MNAFKQKATRIELKIKYQNILKFMVKTDHFSKFAYFKLQ